MRAGRRILDGFVTDSAASFSLPRYAGGGGVPMIT
jgi:hypothetical protein